MEKYPLQINVFPNDEDQRLIQPSIKPSFWSRFRRLIIFLLTFSITAGIALAYILSRPAIYQSSATLLTTAMTPVDQSSSPADLQHVTIQKQVLLSQELLEETVNRLNRDNPNVETGIADIREKLQVKPLKETNLVKMLAEGPDPMILPKIINTWIEVYQSARVRDIETSKASTNQIIRDELKELEAKIEAKRLDLNLFRQRNDIISVGRDENTVIAEMKGLTSSYNNANEEKVKAKARLDAIKKAIEDGQIVVPTQDQQTLTNLEQRLRQLQEKLAEFDERYTREYMALQPSVKFIPEEIKKLKAQIEERKYYGKKIVLADAEQNFEAAKHTVNEIRKQLEDQKKHAADFTARFAKYQTLQTDLEGLEKIYRETQERLVKIESRHVEKYPQVNVVEKAYLSLTPIKPDNFRDSVIALTSSLLLGLFSVWMTEFLTRKPQEQTEIPLSGIQIYQDLGMTTLNAPKTKSAHLENQKVAELPSTHKPRELSDFELSFLLHSANIMGKQLISLILSGISLKEAAELRPENWDQENHSLVLGGVVPRRIPINDALEFLFEDSGKFPPWLTDRPLSEENLASFITLAAVESGLSRPEEINADTVRHAYILFLVRQGLRLSALEQVVGYLPPETLVSYSQYSPPIPDFGVEDVSIVHPVLSEYSAS